ncbi:MAG: hypothetical protein U0457_03400 [Candidatus Sericytochromatia bacterium]
MEKKFLLDHLLITVSKDEFDYWKEKSNEFNFIYVTKKDLEQNSQEACYIRANSLFYLEIMPENNYPGKIGLSLSDLSSKNNFLENLKLLYSTWEFEEKKVYYLDEHWYSAYFSKEMESEITFTWFTEYKGQFLEERKNDLNNKNNIFFSINLSESEYKDFIKIISDFQFIIEELENKTIIKDILGNYFTILRELNQNKRVNLLM